MAPLSPYFGFPSRKKSRGRWPAQPGAVLALLTTGRRYLPQDFPTSTLPSPPYHFIADAWLASSNPFFTILVPGQDWDLGLCWLDNDSTLKLWLSLGPRFLLYKMRGMDLPPLLKRSF